MTPVCWSSAVAARQEQPPLVGFPLLLGHGVLKSYSTVHAGMSSHLLPALPLHKHPTQM